VDNLRYQISTERKCIVREVGGYDEETRNISIILKRKPICKQLSDQEEDGKIIFRRVLRQAGAGLAQAV
jgi:hypothetical protein